MKRIIWTAVVGVVFGVGLACSGSDSLTSLDEVAAAAPGAESSSGTVAGAGSGPSAVGIDGTGPMEVTPIHPSRQTTDNSLRAAIRIRGENLNGLDTLLLKARNLRVFAGTEELEVSAPEAMVVDLSRLDHAWKLGSFVVPEGVESVRVEVTLDDFGGFAGTDAAGYLDSRGAPISFDADVETLSRHGHAVLHLDVTNSFIRVSDRERMLLPEVTVRY